MAYKAEYPPRHGGYDGGELGTTPIKYPRRIICQVPPPYLKRKSVPSTFMHVHFCVRLSLGFHFQAPSRYTLAGAMLTAKEA
eukprot:scaffold78116_cov23-Prasinocladus_malaysianus.AAC.1